MTINSLLFFLIGQSRKVLKIGKNLNIGKSAYQEFVTFLFLENRVVLEVLEICASMIQEK